MTSKQLRSQGLSAGAVPKGWQLVRLGDLVLFPDSFVDVGKLPLTLDS